MNSPAHKLVHFVIGIRNAELTKLTVTGSTFEIVMEMDMEWIRGTNGDSHSFNFIYSIRILQSALLQSTVSSFICFCWFHLIFIWVCCLCHFLLSLSSLLADYSRKHWTLSGNFFDLWPPPLLTTHYYTALSLFCSVCEMTNRRPKYQTTSNSNCITSSH